jgi:hypothetical protein
MSKWMTVAVLLVAALACDVIDVPSDLVRPVDDYCYDGLCGSNQKCWQGECYDRCASNDDCADDCCAKGEGTDKLYCAPSEVCR